LHRNKGHKDARKGLLKGFREAMELLDRIGWTSDSGQAAQPPRNAPGVYDFRGIFRSRKETLRWIRFQHLHRNKGHKDARKGLLKGFREAMELLDRIGWTSVVPEEPAER
jgi:hypothetical protein